MITSEDFALCSQLQPETDDIYLTICHTNGLGDPDYYYAIKERFIGKWCVSNDSEKVVAWAVLDYPRDIMKELMQ